MRAHAAARRAVVQPRRMTGGLARRGDDRGGERRPARVPMHCTPFTGSPEHGSCSARPPALLLHQYCEHLSCTWSRM